MKQIYDLTLLYVEDDDELRKQFLRVLKLKFRTVYQAVDGAQAIDIYRDKQPNIIITDINLPKVDGLELIENIRKEDKETAIVIISAYSDQDKLLRAIKLGLSEYLIKPVPLKKLLLTLEEIVLNNDHKVADKNIITLKNGYAWKSEERILIYGEKQISLTKREMTLLDFMIREIDKVITPYIIEELLWQDKDPIDVNSSMSHMLKRLRKKLPKELIENIYGEGYRISS